MNILKIEDSFSLEQRRAMIDVAAELLRLDHRLWEIKACTPSPPDEAEMWEYDLPLTAAVKVRCRLEAVRQDCLQDAVEKLTEDAQNTDNDVRLENLEEMVQDRKLLRQMEMAQNSPPGPEKETRVQELVDRVIGEYKRSQQSRDGAETEAGPRKGRGES
jgi:hypothetical protein